MRIPKGFNPFGGVWGSAPFLIRRRHLKLTSFSPRICYTESGECNDDLSGCAAALESLGGLCAAPHNSRPDACAAETFALSAGGGGRGGLRAEYFSAAAAGAGIAAAADSACGAALRHCIRL